MPIYLSASSVADFIRCPQKVLYRITKPFPEVPSREMLTGRAIHSVLERGWVDRDLALNILQEEKQRYKLTKAELTNLFYMVDLFFLNFKGYLKDDDKIEYSFKLPLYDDVFIVGKMDRISGNTVFDWKSGRTSKNLSNDVQCMIYDYAYQELFGKTPSVCIASLQEGTLIPYKKDKLYYSEVFDKIIPRMIKTLKNESYERLGMFNHSCFRCQYKQGCLGARDVMDS